MLSLMKDLKVMYGIDVKYAIFDRACKQEGVCAQFVHTKPGAKEQNSRVRPKFVTLFNRVHAMLNGRKFSS